MAKPAEEFYVESSEGRQGPFTDMQGARSRARAIAHGGKLAKVVKLTTRHIVQFTPQPRPDPVEEILGEE
jgi:hypothetical protein